MNIKSTVLRTMFAGALSLGIVSSAGAQTGDTGSATVTIETNEGGLTALISDVNFGTFPYSVADRAVDGTITINVEDNRGTQVGWDLYLSGTDFSEAGTPTTTFPISALSLDAGTVTETSTIGSVAPTSSAASPVTNASAVVMTAAAGEGDGHWENERSATLTIPGGTLVGTYESTLTVSFTAAP